jgi:hypothetical protein
MNNTLTQAQLVKRLLRHVTTIDAQGAVVHPNQRQAVNDMLDRLDKTWDMEAFTAPERARLRFLLWRYDTGQIQYA